MGCARPNVPAVYARISGGLDWIRSEVCSLSDNPPDYCYTPTETRRGTVRVDVSNDGNPQDVSWSIRDAGGRIVGQSGSTGAPNTLVSTAVELGSGIFEFEINDSFDDASIGQTTGKLINKHCKQ